MNGPASLPRLLALLSLAALSLSGCGTAGSSAMTVDGIQISDEQVAHETAVWQFLADLNQSPCGSAEPADASTGVLAESEQSACVRAALANEVELVLSDRYAAEHGIAADETDVKQQIASIERQIQKLEDRRKALSEQLASATDGQKIAEINRELTEIKAKVAPLEERWVALQDERQ